MLDVLAPIEYVEGFGPVGGKGGFENPIDFSCCFSKDGDDDFSPLFDFFELTTSSLIMLTCLLGLLLSETGELGECGEPGDGGEPVLVRS